MSTLLDRVRKKNAANDVVLEIPQSASPDGLLSLVNEGDGRYEIVERAGHLPELSFAIGQACTGAQLSGGNLFSRRDEIANAAKDEYVRAEPCRHRA